MNIVAIGGGELDETRSINQFLVELSQINNPNLLFVGTASNDSPGYFQGIKNEFEPLGCAVEQLALLAESPSRAAIEHKLAWANIVYVGGGDAQLLIKTWQSYQLANLLKTSAQHGTILAGLSAGAACWYEHMDSDHQAFSGAPDWQYETILGGGILPGLFVSHLTSEGRHTALATLAKTTAKPVIACDDHAAVWHNNGTNQIVTCRSTSRVIVLSKTQKHILSSGDSFADQEINLRQFN